MTARVRAGRERPHGAWVSRAFSTTPGRRKACGPGRVATAEERPRRLPSVRARTALAAVAVAGMALVVAGVLLVHILSSSLTAAVDTSARLRVEAVANIVTGGTVPPVLAVPGDDSVMVQVIDPTGRVIASSDNVADEPPLVFAASATPAIRVVTVHAVPVAEQGPSRLAFRSVSTPRGTWTVAAAASLAPARHTVATLSVALAAGIPLLLALLGLTAWLLAGRALAPVEAIRSRVAAISGRALHRRVPEPGGRDEVARLARTMNDMLERLEESQASQRRFVANASHELRSPVASALTQLQVDRAHPETADWEATAEGVESELYRVQDLVANLLELARADEGASARDRTAVALDEVLRHEIRRHRAVSPVPIDAGALPPLEVHANATELRRAVANVMANAVRHAGTRVSVDLRDNGDDIVIAVADDGPGIGAADRERVFGRFVRLDDARSRDAGGSGLGLAITKEIVESHGGWVAVGEAHPGACFELHFPHDAAR